MIASYWARLAWIELACFFLIYLSAETLLAGAACRVVRLAERFAPRSAARMLFWLRVSPLVLAVAAIAAVCMPSYVWLEASGSREHVGWLCIGAGCGGGLVWLVCAGRLLQNLARSRRYMARWTHEGRRAQLCENSTPAWVIGSDVPFLALAGIVQPRLIASRGLVRVLSPGQLNAAVGHEAAHQASHDNLKRLILRSIPRIVPFGGGMERIEHAWMKFAERAADDWAVAGQAARALLLAEALVRVARIGGAYASPLTAPLLADARELHARVDRLVNPAPIPPVAGPSGRRTIWLGVGLFAAIAVGPAVLRAVHELLESLIR